MARSGVWVRSEDHTDNALPVDTAIEILLEERSNVIARRDSINLTATAFLGFGAVLIPVVADSKAGQSFREISLGFLLGGMICMILCLLDWELSGSKYPRLQSVYKRQLRWQGQFRNYCQTPVEHEAATPMGPDDSAGPAPVNVDRRRLTSLRNTCLDGLRWLYLHWPIRRQAANMIDPSKLRSKIVVRPDDPKIAMYDIIAEAIDQDSSGVVQPKRTKLGVGLLFFVVSGVLFFAGCWL